MNILNQEYDLVPVQGLKRHPKNPRKGDPVKIAESIAVNGFYGALIVQKSTGYILAGNHRFDEAKKQGATDIPVVWVDVEDDEAERILLADNRTGDLAEYDDDGLRSVLAGLLERTGTLDGTGYDADFLADADDAKDEAETLLDQSIQLRPQREYVVVMCEDAAEWERVRAALRMGLVRRGGYKVGSQFDAPGPERVVKASRLLELLPHADSDPF
jgi:hypothetical protein